MSNDEEIVKAISEAAMKVFTREEFLNTPKPAALHFLGMVERRLKDDGPPPTLAELEGLKELATEYLWHPALGG